LTRKLVDVRGPGRPHHAAEQLRLLAGNSHELHSAIVVARDDGFPCLAGDDRPSIRATASKIKSAVRSLDAFENELDRHLKSDRLFLISSLPR
jgi:predicted house-cleaning NTP pyrophosphatase (Maf/HAM1 superfamily)